MWKCISRPSHPPELPWVRCCREWSFIYGPSTSSQFSVLISNLNSKDAFLFVIHYPWVRDDYGEILALCVATTRSILFKVRFSDVWRGAKSTFNFIHFIAIFFVVVAAAAIFASYFFFYFSLSSCHCQQTACVHFDNEIYMYVCVFTTVLSDDRHGLTAVSFIVDSVHLTCTRSLTILL